MQGKILLAHGGGGLLSAELLAEEILPRFGHAELQRLEDAAVLASGGGALAFTTDSYVVSPWRFPGGTIGDLAVCGTLNDLSMAGARPLALSLGLILEEGLEREVLAAVLDDVRRRSGEAGVPVVCGDTKVVPRGQADGIYINTAGVGELIPAARPTLAAAAPGDRLVVTGVVGLHGLAVMLSRGELSLRTPVESDVASLQGAVAALYAAGTPVKALRDLTRGGLAMALHDLAGAAGVSVRLEEARLPTDPAQEAACELLGLDPLQIACEGRFLAVLPAGAAAAAVALLRQEAPCREAAVVGEVVARGEVPVEVVTAIGTRRVLSPPRGEQMPRIC